ncbi:Lysocardiolipin acyltransferase 1 isoform X2 [Oopsacas minuta]|uniref:Lysocardiolipin acyltransferase 1 isoform X2 n=1 Tax=Oopsacas minuta TaxID=111878 RepID=A0AAV7JCV7_9METZ|nr:Lysocardiolipin acyltransferase 1 isoform X2 [Oopsacas minuta]
MAKRHCEIKIVGERNTLESIAGWLKGTLFFVICYFPSAIGTIYYLLIWMPFIFIHQPIQQFFSELYISMWYQLISVSFYFNYLSIFYYTQILQSLYSSMYNFQIILSIYGCKIVITGNATRFSEKSLILMNHRTRFDWLFHWALMDKLGCQSYSKIVLKSGMRKLPGVGVMMQMCCYIYLKRNWDRDKAYVEQILSHYRQSGRKYQILLFPEGTNLSPNTVGISNKFAAANNLTEYTYTLHPRYTGFLFFLQNLYNPTNTLPKDTQLNSVIDSTVGYKGHFLVDEKSLFSGYLPEEIHFHIKQYKMSDIPSSEEEREKWLRDLWREKEERLKKFYEQDYSFGPEVKNIPEKSLFLKLLILIFWTSPFLITYLLWLHYLEILLAFLLLVLIFYYLQYTYDGLENLIAIRYFKQFILFCLIKTKFVLTGDISKFPDRSLVIMNHRTMLDWMYYWCLVEKIACPSYLKIVLKDDFKNVPGFGWAPQFAAFIFLKRVWEKDRKYLNKMLSFYTLSKKPYQLLMFPEGTNLHPVTVPRSNKFANANNLPEYEYSLHPRSTGFLYVLDKLHPSSEQSHIDRIVDITLGFKGNIPLYPGVLLSGYLPDEVHFHIKQYKMSDIPSSEEEREKWLRDLWREKEERLKKFYEQDYSFGPEVKNIPEKSLFLKLLILIFWTSPFLITYLLWLHYPLILLAFLLLVPMFYYLQYTYDGLENLVVNSYLKQFHNNFEI